MSASLLVDWYKNKNRRKFTVAIFKACIITNEPTLLKDEKIDKKCLHLVSSIGCNITNQCNN
jgi:hypothetical protein